MLAVIHGALFQDLDAATYRPGEYKTEALQKREFVLNGDSVVYADPSLIERSLAFLFDEERSHVYGIEFDEAQLEHLGRFIARLWQVHPFDNLLNEAEHELRSRDLACKALFDDPSFLRNVDPSQAISL